MMTFYLIFLIIIIINFLGYYISKKSYWDKEKSSMFECGFDPLTLTRAPFSLQFFKIAIIFLIFDIEIIIILPITISLKSMNLNLFLSSLIVLMIITVGLLYEWNEGALNWLK